MDVKELQNSICAKCVHCYDKYSYAMWVKSWVGIPNKDNYRYYCNCKHEYVDPDRIQDCFASW